MKIQLLYSQIIFIKLFLMLPIISFAQASKDGTETNSKSIQESFDNLKKEKRMSPSENENEEGEGHHQFKRWEHLMVPRLAKDKNLNRSSILLGQYDKLKANKNSVNEQSLLNDNWSYTGSNGGPDKYGQSHAGRVNVIRIDPNNPNVIYVGGACGGLWKSTNHGLTWSAMSDHIASISVSDLCIDPNNSNIIYLATGDPFASWTGGGLYSAGIIKSTDGGITWKDTGLSYQQNNGQTFARILINPTQPTILITCGKDSIFRSSDSGLTWSVVQTTSKLYDLEFKPGSPDIIYAYSEEGFFISTDGGLTFNLAKSNLGSGFGNIAVTEANPNKVALSIRGLLWVSTDGGSTWQSKNSPTNVAFMGDYFNVLSISPTDENFFVAGGAILAKSADGGDTWSQFVQDDLHVDHHDFVFTSDGSGAYSANDGGVNFTSEIKKASTTNQYASGPLWTDISDGLQIKQYYTIASSPINPEKILAGAQDNGTDYFDGATWIKTSCCDGTGCAFDPRDDSIYYSSANNGIFFKSNKLSPGLTVNYGPQFYLGSWVSSLAIDPANHAHVLLGSQSDLYSTLDGVSWDIICKHAADGRYINIIKYAPSNPNIIYVCSDLYLYRSDDAGHSFRIVFTGNSPNPITDFAISSINPDQFWVTFSGYTDGQRIGVGRSTDGSETSYDFSDFSGSLPPVPVNCIEYESSSNEGLYIGTDLGIFFRDNTMTDWIFYSKNLPNVIVSDIEIIPTTSKIRAATFGRGIWESPTQNTVVKTAPSVTVAQPACTSATGTITVSSRNEIDNYSFDNGFTYQTSNVKADLVPGTYYVKTKGFGMVSEATPVLITYPQILSDAPVVSITQPNCTLATGTITVSIQNNSDTYSFDGGSNFNQSNSKSGLVNGVYDISVKNELGCVSISTNVTINAQPTTPAQPVIDLLLPDPAHPVLEVSAAANYQWYKDGTAISGACSSTYNIKDTGLYMVVVFSSDGCQSVPSAAIPFTVITAIEPPTTHETELYPDPVEDKLHLKFADSSPRSITVFSAIGQIIYSESTTSSEYEKEVSDYTSGFYLIRIVEVSGYRILKFVKK
jgi:photosystem II stability/assembly factor-like uncharacterized protein